MAVAPRPYFLASLDVQRGSYPLRPKLRDVVRQTISANMGSDRNIFPCRAFTPEQRAYGIQRVLAICVLGGRMMQHIGEAIEEEHVLFE